MENMKKILLMELLNNRLQKKNIIDDKIYVKMRNEIEKQIGESYPIFQKIS